MCYVSENNIYITEEYYGKSETENIQTSIRKIAYDKGTLDAVGQTKIDGVLNDSFSIDEYNGYLRIAATVIPSDYNNRIMPVPYVEEGGSDVIVEDEVAVDNASIEQMRYMCWMKSGNDRKYSESGERGNNPFSEIYGRYRIFCDI